MRFVAGAGLVLVAFLAMTPPVNGQDLVERFKWARLVRIAQEHEHRRLPPKAAEHLATRGDTLAMWMRSRAPALPVPELPPAPDPLTIDSIRVFGKLERVVFQSRYGNTRWAFLQGVRREPIDTTATSDLRARMQAHFGPPTFTLAEMDSIRGRAAEALIQFEYWLVVNDSMPAMVLDVNGPLGRGVVVATDARWRHVLDRLRYGLLERLFTDPRREPYVDYFYQVDTSAWYVTGFDGASFFYRRIDRPDLRMGRPLLGEYVPGQSNK